MHLERLISVLETIAIAGKPLSAAELHQLTQLPLPTCYRLLQQLAEQRLLDEQTSSSRYVIGERLLRIAVLAKTDADICNVTSPILNKTAIEFGEAVFISRFHNNGVKIIHVETPKDPAISYVHPGLGYRPMHACSCAKAIAAFADDAIREQVLSGPKKSYTDSTMTARNVLEKELDSIQARGFAECVEEIEVGISSVAVPVKVDQLGTVFSVGTIGPIRRFTAAHRESLGEKLIGVADGISVRIAAANVS